MYNTILTVGMPADIHIAIAPDTVADPIAMRVSFLIKHQCPGDISWNKELDFRTEVPR